MVEKNLVGKLEAELEKLKHLLGLGHHLRVKWIPNNYGKLSGKVKGGLHLHLRGGGRGSFRDSKARISGLCDQPSDRAL